MNAVTLFNNGLTRELNNLFNDTWYDFTPFWKGKDVLFDNTPDDLVELNDKYELSIELPGVKKEDIKISFENNILHVKAEKKDNYEGKDINKIKSFRNYRVIEKAYKISDSISKDKIDAELKDGILTISCPKSPEVKPKTIEIK